MPSSGPAFFSVVADGGGTGSSWAGVSSAEGSPDLAYATNNPGPGINTTWLKCATWGSTIPGGDTPVGVTFAFNGHATSGETLSVTYAVVIGGVIQSSSSGSVTIGTSDAWSADVGSSAVIPGGAAPSSSDVNSSGFGIAFQLTSASGNHLSIDSVRMTVFYNLADTMGPELIAASSTIRTNPPPRAAKQRSADYWLANGVPVADYVDDASDINSRVMIWNP